MDPKTFFEEYVAPAVADAMRAPLDIRLSTIALCELDNLSEHFILSKLRVHFKKGAVTAARDALAAAQPALGLARDVHDTHKHGRLTRTTAKITLAQRPTVRPMGGILGGAPIGAAPLRGTLDHLVIELDDGQRHGVGMVIHDCVSYWRSALGLP